MDNVGCILRLAPDVVRRLAAGEFISRPASAVKELIENSLDAKATSVKITVKNGGMKFLQVLDNGSGICKDDLEILCERHATSKLQNFEELESIDTYGFRGEAMASISSVAQVSLRTKTADARCGYEVSYVDGSMKGNPVPCGMNNGTQITVENMFYNMPLRQKALQKFGEEFNKVEEVVIGYAIHNSSVSFMLTKLGQKDVSVKTPTNSTISKNIGLIFGPEVSRNLVEEEGHDELFQFKYHIVVTNLKYSSTTMKFLLFVNHRLVKSEGLKKDINELYSVYLPQKKKPFVYIGLEMNPHIVDVNVHPSKEKVFYLHEDSVNEKIISVIKNAIMGKEAYKAYQGEIEILCSANSTSGSEDTGKSNDKDLLINAEATSFNQNLSEANSQVESISYSRSCDQSNQINREDNKVPCDSCEVQNKDDYEESVKDISSIGFEHSSNSLLESTVFSKNRSDESVGSESMLSNCHSSAKNNSNHMPSFKPKEAIIFQRPSAKNDSSQKLDSFFSSSQGCASPILRSQSSTGSLSRSSNNNQKFGMKSKSPSILGRSWLNNNSSPKINTFFSGGNESNAVRTRPLNMQTGSSGCPPVIDTSDNVHMVRGNDLSESREKIQNPEKNLEVDNEKMSVDYSVSSLGVLKMNVLKLCDRNFQDILRQSIYLKCVDFRYMLILENNMLYSCDLPFFCEEFFYQLVLDNFRRLDVLPLLEPAPLSLLLEAAGRKNSKTLDLCSLTRTLKEAAALLDDFFSISIDKEGNLKSIPLILEEYLPSKQDLPTLILNLASNVQWDSEHNCIKGASHEIAKYYSIIPSEENPFISECDWNSFVESTLFPLMKENLYPSKELFEKYTNKIVNIESL